MKEYKKGEEHFSSHWLKQQEKYEKEIIKFSAQDAADLARANTKNDNEIERDLSSLLYDHDYSYLDRLEKDKELIEDELGFIRLGSDFQGEHE